MVSHITLFAILVNISILSNNEASSQEMIIDSSNCTTLPWPPLDENMRITTSYGIRSADNTMIDLVSHGKSLPASGQALVTTVSTKPSMIIEILTGSRMSATSNKLLGRVTFDISDDNLPRGIPQVLVKADLRHTRLEITIQNMFSGHEMVAIFNGQGQINASSDAEVRSFTDKSLRDFFPRPWKFDNPYISVPHPGYTFGGRFIKLKQRPRKKSDGIVPQKHGDVVPSFTADKVWPAAYVMGTFLETIERREPDVILKRVLELGAGTGLVGMAAALINQGETSHITLTDLPENLRLLHENVELNSMQNTVNIHALDWTKPIPSELAGPWDVVVAADCVFWEYLFEPLIDTLAQLALNSKRVYVSITHRFDRTETFLALLKNKCILIEKMEAMNIFKTDIYRIYGEKSLGCELTDH